MQKEYLDKFLTELEQQKISQFVMDEEMKEAVKKVLLFSIYNSGTLAKGKPHDPMHNFALVAASDPRLDNGKLGEFVRSAYQGINALELGFSDLERYKLEKMPDVKPNQAR